MRRRLVTANERSKCFGSRAADSDDIWWTTASGSALATDSPTAALSSPSTTTGSAPRVFRKPVLAAWLVVAVDAMPALDQLGDQPPADHARAPCDVDVHRSHLSSRLFLVPESRQRDET